MLRISELDTIYRKREKNLWDVDTVDKNLADARLVALGDHYK